MKKASFTSSRCESPESAVTEDAIRPGSGDSFKRESRSALLAASSGEEEEGSLREGEEDEGSFC